MEKWKDEIIESLDHIKRAEPSTDTFLKIQKKIKAQKANGRQWMAIAASVALAIGANLYFIINYNTGQSVSQSDAYASITTNYDLYDYE